MRDGFLIAKISSGLIINIAGFRRKLIAAMNAHLDPDVVLSLFRAVVHTFLLEFATALDQSVEAFTRLLWSFEVQFSCICGQVAVSSALEVFLVVILFLGASAGLVRPFLTHEFILEIALLHRNSLSPSLVEAKL